ncbi:hypothetical protein BVY03_04695 [bacterium K02(2017)]|nr:hypothetical protein BVY03_04695 [bacterium K02(2017)]
MKIIKSIAPNTLWRIINLVNMVILVNLPDVADNTIDVTSPGFQPDVIFTSYIGDLIDADSDASNDHDGISFGWAIDPAVQATSNRYSIMRSSQDALATSNVRTRFDNTQSGTGSLDASYDINDFDSSGFSVTTRGAAAAGSELMGYLAIDLGATPYVYSVARTSRTSTGNDVDADAGFTPVFLMGIGSAVSTIPNVNVSGGSMVIGMTDGSDSISVSIHDEDDVGTTNTHSRTTNTEFMQAYANDGSIDWEAGFGTFDNSGWTLNYTDAASLNYLTAFLAIGQINSSAKITGSLYLDEGVTKASAGTTMLLSVNGDATRQTQVTDASGDYTFDAATIPGDVLTLYIDGSISYGATVSVSDGELITGFDVYANYLILREDNTGSMRNSILEIADNYGDSDITNVYTMSGSDMTLGSGIELLIPTGHTYLPGGAVNAHDVDVDGVFSMGSSTHTVSGSFDSTTGSFSSSGIVNFTSTSAETITSNSSSFNSISINGSGGDFVIEDTLDINGDLTISAGSTLDAHNTESNSITLTGDWTNAGTFLARSGTVTLDATHHTIGGITTFNNFSITETTNNSSDLVLIFDNLRTQTITGTFTCLGYDDDDRINIRSDSAGVQFEIDLPGSRNVNWLDVKDSNNLDPVYVNPNLNQFVMALQH